MTASLIELDKDGTQYVVENPGSKDSILVLAIVDDIPENYHNMRLILEMLGFPLVNRNIKWVGDLALILTLLGTSLLISSCCFNLFHRQLWSWGHMVLSLWRVLPCKA